MKTTVLNYSFHQSDTDFLFFLLAKTSVKSDQNVFEAHPPLRKSASTPSASALCAHRSPTVLQNRRDIQCSVKRLMRRLMHGFVTSRDVLRRLMHTFFWVQNVFEFFYNEFGCKNFSNFFYNEFGCKNFSIFFTMNLAVKIFQIFFTMNLAVKIFRIFLQ